MCVPCWLSSSSTVRPECVSVMHPRYSMWCFACTSASASSWKDCGSLYRLKRRRLWSLLPVRMLYFCREPSFPSLYPGCVNSVMLHISVRWPM